VTSRLITEFSEDYTVHVFVQSDASPNTHDETIDIGPDKTTMVWPSASETHDRVAEAVKVVLDRWWYDMTGEKVER
jgi:hypothetical protein